jgi:hypothetical protein
MRHWFRKFVSYVALVYSYYSRFSDIYVLTYCLSYLHVVEIIMTCYVVFRGQKSGVYNSWGIYNEYILDLSGADYQSYSTRIEAKEAYVAFLEHKNKDRKPEYVARKIEHVTNMWC